MLLLGMAGAAIVRLLLGPGTNGDDPAAVPLAHQALLLAGHAAGQAIGVAQDIYMARPILGRAWRLSAAYKF